jgi:hypothetical protein
MAKMLFVAETDDRTIYRADFDVPAKMLQSKRFWTMLSEAAAKMP